MTRICQLALVTAATVLAAATGLVAQMPKPVTEKVTMTATIEAIDKSTRLVMLKGEKGNVVAVQVGEQMKRFNELKVGDKVSATYTESVAVNVRQPGQPAPTSSSAVTPSTGAPGATAAAQDTITVTVLSVDKARPVGERQAEGRLRSQHARREPQVPRGGQGGRYGGHHLHPGAAARSRAGQVAGSRAIGSLEVRPAALDDRDT